MKIVQRNTDFLPNPSILRYRGILLLYLRYMPTRKTRSIQRKGGHLWGNYRGGVAGKGILTLKHGWVQNEDRRQKSLKRTPHQNRLKSLEKGSNMILD